MGELLELRLTARTSTDQAIAPNPDDSVTVAVGEPFDLEVSYEDFRTFGNDLGAFQLLVDFIASEDAIVPVLNETIEHRVSEAVTMNSGTLTFSLEGSATTHQTSFANYSADRVAETAAALATFGYDPSDTTLTAFTLPGQLGVRIHYEGEDFYDLDQPDILLTSSEPGVSTQTVEFAPKEFDGVTPNSAAVRFNIKTESRTLNGGEDFYTQGLTGAFDPQTGDLLGIGGFGPIDPMGVRGSTQDGSLPEPFDAFSMRVRVTREVAALTIDLALGSAPEALLLYGEDDPIPPGMVLTDDDATVVLTTLPEPGATGLAVAALCALGALRRAKA